MSKRYVERYLPYARIQSEIKRANRRIAQVAETYGLQSEVYKSMIEPFMNKELQKYTHLNPKTGVLQISNKPYNLMNPDKKSLSKKGRGVIQLLRNVKTVKELRKQAKDYAGQYTDDKLTNQQLDELIEDVKQIENEFAATKEAFYQVAQNSEINKTLNHKDKKWSYSDLNEKIKEMKSFINNDKKRNKTFNRQPVSFEQYNQFEVK